MLSVFNNNYKEEFKDKVLELTKDIPGKKRKDSINNNLNYILNNYKAIMNILDIPIELSMESYISHYIADMFSSRSKGYSSLNINKYLKLNNYNIYGINLFDLYLKSYSNDEETNINQKELDYSLFEKNTGISVLKNGEITGTYKNLYTLAY